jgi:hypothetical protein
MRPTLPRSILSNSTIVPALDARQRKLEPHEVEINHFAKVLQGILPTRVIGEPDKADADNLIADLLVLARGFDRVIEAYGEYARSTLGISQSDVEEHFRGVAVGALEGNATFVIAEAVKDRIAAREDDEADHAIALRRGK